MHIPCHGRAQVSKLGPTAHSVSESTLNHELCMYETASLQDYRLSLGVEGRVFYCQSAVVPAYLEIPFHPLFPGSVAI